MRPRKIASTLFKAITERNRGKGYSTFLVSLGVCQSVPIPKNDKTRTRAAIHPKSQIGIGKSARPPRPCANAGSVIANPERTISAATATLGNVRGWLLKLSLRVLDSLGESIGTDAIPSRSNYGWGSVLESCISNDVGTFSRSLLSKPQKRPYCDQGVQIGKG